MKRFLFVLFLIGSVASASPVPGQLLDKDIFYLRIENADTEAAAINAAWSRPALLLDLRYVEGSAESLAALSRRLTQGPAAPGAHRIILVSPATPPQIVESTAHGAAGQLTVGPRSPVLADVIVETGLAEDKKAFDAADNGVPLEKLFGNTLEKHRFDEAALAHSRATAASGPEDDPDSLPEPPSATPEAPKPPAPPMHDLVLERALEIHRGLIALKL